MSDADGPRGGADGACPGERRDLDATVGLAEDVRSAFELLPTAVVCLEGPEHVIVAANAAYRAAMGKDDIIGLPVAQAVPELAGQMAFEMVDRVWATGRTEVQREWRIEVYDPDGNPSEIYVDFTGTPYRGADGEQKGIIFQAEVVTERARQRLEAAALESQARRDLLAAREVVTSLQLAMLPSALPALPDVDLAARYLVADADSAAGGDWFDAVPLGDGRVAVVVGDVVGHGVEASAVMGGLRAVLAAGLASTKDLAASLHQLDQYAATVRGAHATTVCVAVVDPASTRVTYCTAGHPPPLVVTPDDATFVPTTGARPLGTGGPFPLAHLDLQPGAALVLYSDGLVERPGRSPAQSTLELTRVARDAYRGSTPGAGSRRLVQRLCTSTLELLVRETGHTDDVTIVAAHRPTRPSHEVDVVLPAHPTSIQDARLETALLIETNHLSHASAMAFHHAVSELVANAVEHAYVDRTDQDGHVRLRARLTPAGSLRAVVSDDGVWRDRGTRHQGLGLSMAEQLADSLVIERGDAVRPGTTVTVEVRAHRDADLVTLPGRVPARAPGTGDFSIVVREAGRDRSRTHVDVAGPVDLLASDHLRSTLLVTASRQEDVVLDLSEVTLLSSRGVQLLAELADSPVTGPRLWVHAPPGTPAAHVLELTHLGVRRLPAGWREG